MYACARWPWQLMTPSFIVWCFKISHFSPKNHVHKKPKLSPSLRMACNEVSPNHFRKLTVITVISLMIEKYEGCWESNGFAKVSHSKFVTFQWNFVLTWFLFLQLQFSVGLVLCYAWFKMDDWFLAGLKCVKQWAVIKVLTHKTQRPIIIYPWLLAFCGEVTVDVSTVHDWVRKLRDSSENLDLNEYLQSGRPVTAAHDLKRHRVHKFLRRP